MIPVEEHQARCLAAVHLSPAREVSLLDAVGCLLAEDVRARVAVPGFANSAMDGYAVRLADLAGLDHAASVELPVAADVPAGPAVPMTLDGGVAVRVMTGAPLPEGTQAVVPVEWTDGGTATVVIRQAPRLGQYLRRLGEDVTAGERVLAAGTRLAPRRIGLAAAVGRARLLVHPRPRVVVLSTGSELVPPDGEPGFGQIYDSNGYALVAAARQAGAEADYLGFVGDDEDDVRAALQRACAGADLVITSGGVSAGAYDPVKAVLASSASMWFGKVAMQPGMPQGVGVLASDAERPTAVLTLPGNPVSSLVSFEVFGRPMLRRMLGEPEVLPAAIPVRAATGWTSPPHKRQYLRAVFGGAVAGGAGESAADGVRTVRPVGAQGSHLVADLAEATCLVIVPEEVTEVRPGDELTCLPLDPQEWS